MKEMLDSIRKIMSSVFWRMLAIATYLGVLFSLFAIQRYLLLGDGSLSAHIGFSFLNAVVLAKVILVGQELRIGDNFRNKKMFYVILVKSAIFAVLLLIFRLVEEAVTGLVEGKQIYEAVFSGRPGLGHDKFQGMVLISLVMFFALTPFFAYLEFEWALGAKRMRGLIFGDAADLETYAGEEETKPETMEDSQIPWSLSRNPDVAINLDTETRANAEIPIRLQDSSQHQDTYYYEEAGSVIGPVSEGQLLRLINHGDIGPETLVYNVTVSKGWLMLSETSLI